MGIPAIWAPPDPKSLVKQALRGPHFASNLVPLGDMGTTLMHMLGARITCITNGVHEKRSAVSVVMDASLVSSSVGAMEIEVQTTDDTETQSDMVDVFSDIANYLSRGTYPADANKATKSSLRKRSKFFTMEGGHLHYVSGKVNKYPRLVVQSVDEQQRLIKTIHDTAYLGRDKTLSQLNERYYWPDMYKQVCAYVSRHNDATTYIYM